MTVPGWLIVTSSVRPDFRNLWIVVFTNLKSRPAGPGVEEAEVEVEGWRAGADGTDVFAFVGEHGSAFERRFQRLARPHRLPEYKGFQKASAERRAGQQRYLGLAAVDAFELAVWTRHIQK